jgi:hypothetical protein
MSTAYKFTNVINPGDPTFNQLLGINNSGVIAGYFGSGAAGSPNQGYTTTLASITSGTPSFTPENFPGSVQTQVIGINDHGATVGFYATTNNGVGLDANYGFYTNTTTKPGVFASVNDPLTPPATTALPTNNLLDINNSGIAVGFYNDASGDSHGYTFNVTTDAFSAPINFPGAASTQTAGINNVGDIVGSFTNNGGQTFSAFLDASGTFTELNDPGMVSTQLFGINDKGLAVGDAVGPKGGMFGVTYNDKTKVWTSYHVGIDPSGLFATTFNGVNNAGDIVGFYVNKAGSTIGLLATPDSSPSAVETGATAQSFDAYSLLASDAGMPSGFLHETARVNDGLNVAVGSHELVQVTR